MEDKLNKRKLQAEKTKKLLVEVITSMLSTKDLDQIKIRDICQEANVSTGTFYLYFKSKEEALLYIYRGLDETFLKLKLNKAPYENIALILDNYYHLMSPESIDFDRKLYKCHLSHYDSYFFSEERIVFKLLKKELMGYINVNNYDKATWMVLEFTRGRIYNKMIKFIIPDDKWYTDQVLLTLKYIKFIEAVI